ncbi:MAG: exodeoxyribonuclease VII large subunit [Thermodesulfobacteriota bacterium]
MGSAPWRPEPGEILTVGDLVARARQALEAGFASVWVEGEVTNLRVPSSGHAYFTLSDERAQLRAVCFRAVVRLLRLELEDGARVLARGRLTLYEARGDVQLVVEDLEPLGEGLARLELEALKRRLAAEGLFAPERKRPLPPLPRAVGVVTSPTGAALRDVLQVLRRRAPGVSVYLAPAAVQGEGAAAALRAALALAASHPEVEVIVLGRGGGSAEDLSAFNEEALVRAVAACPVPVIAAVGHEIDVTLVDFAADLRAPTPSAAAELAVREWARWGDQVRSAGERLGSAVLRRLGQWRREVERLDPALRSPAARVARLRIALDRRAEALEAALVRRVLRTRARVAAAETRLARLAPERCLGAGRERLGRLEERLQAWPDGALALRRREILQREGELRALSPLAVLGRGYALVRRRSGGLVRDAASCRVDEALEVRLSRGELDCRVTGVRGEG